MCNLIGGNDAQASASPGSPVVVNATASRDARGSSTRRNGPARRRRRHDVTGSAAFRCLPVDDADAEPRRASRCPGVCAECGGYVEQSLAWARRRNRAWAGCAQSDPVARQARAAGSLHTRCSADLDAAIHDGGPAAKSAARDPLRNEGWWRSAKRRIRSRPKPPKPRRLTDGG